MNRIALLILIIFSTSFGQQYNFIRYDVKDGLALSQLSAFETLSDGRLRFAVILSKKNGETLIIGPCCGESEEESPPDSIFSVFAKQFEDGYKVTGMPPFKP